MAISNQIRKNLRSASLIRRVADEGIAMRKDGKGPVYDLSLGNPILEPPKAFTQALRRHLESPPSGAHRYMTNNGYPAVREAVAGHLKQAFDIDFTSEHISMSVGAAGGINTVLKALLDPGDEVVIFTPYFVEYGFYISNHGGVPVMSPTDEQFQIDIAALEQKLTSRTKVILLNTPNNPTGVVYTAECLQALADLLEAHRKKGHPTVYLLNDSPYRRLVYDQPAAPEPFSFYPHSILATSFSKDLAVPGERIGYVAFAPGCEEVELLMEAMGFCSRVLGFVNAPALMQWVLPDLLEAMIDLDIYRSKRDLLVQGLRQLGCDLVVPGGAFYLFPKAPGGDDLAFFQKLKDHRVLIVPGSGFGAPGYFRIAYCTTNEVLEHALDVFRQIL